MDPYAFAGTHQCSDRMTNEAAIVQHHTSDRENLAWEPLESHDQWFFDTVVLDVPFKTPLLARYTYELEDLTHTELGHTV